jgi:hypothetical protein
VDSLTSTRFSHVRTLGLQLRLEQALRRDMRWNRSDTLVCVFIPTTTVFLRRMEYIFSKYPCAVARQYYIALHAAT